MHVQVRERVVTREIHAPLSAQAAVDLVLADSDATVEFLERLTHQLAHAGTGDREKLRARILAERIAALQSACQRALAAKEPEPRKVLVFDDVARTVDEFEVARFMAEEAQPGRNRAERRRRAKASKKRR